MQRKQQKSVSIKLPRSLGSNPVSRRLRPIVEKRRILPAVMIAANAGLMSMAMVVPSHAFDYTKVPETVVVERPESEVVVTAESYQFPVPESLGVSQGYHGLHWGVDVRAPKGSLVVAMAAGVVIEVRDQAFGYGKHVRVAHEGTAASLYAHLDSIEVAVGQRVQKGQELGTVGTTGWATGSHLHLEVSEGTRTINPLQILNTR